MSLLLGFRACCFAKAARLALLLTAAGALSGCGSFSYPNYGSSGAYPGAERPAPPPRSHHAAAPTQPAAPVAAQPARTHRVVKGDTLYSLSKRYGVELAALKAVNGIGPSAGLSLGQILRIPGAGGAPAATAAAGPARDFSLNAEKAQIAASALGPRRIQRPVPGKILRGWGEGVGRRKNAGVDLAARAGDPVSAAADGKVAFVSDPTSPVGAVVLIEHPGGMTTIYGRLTRIAVRPGQQVRAGDIIARIADRVADRPALHFEIRYGSEPVNPTPFL